MGKTALCACVATAALMSPFGAACAAGADAAAAAPSAEVETLIVTAQKRAEDVQKVPLAITAISGEQLQRQHVDTLQQLRTIDPSVNYRQSTGPHSSGFLIRGVGTSSFSTGIEQSVSTVVDGVVLADPSAAQNLSDIERVEILRGPQGMLFGKNASAGVVSITTRQPRIGEFEGNGRIAAGTRDEWIAQGAVNIPINDSMAGRISVNYRHLQANAHNNFLDEGIDPIDQKSIRGKLLWQPNDQLKAVLSADYSYSSHFCCNPTWRVITPGYIVDYATRPYGVVAGPKNTDAALDFEPYGKGKVYGASLAIDYKLGEYTITAISGWQESHKVGIFDGDQHALNYISYNGSQNSYRNVSQELRLTSPVSDHFDYVAGLYYYESWNVGIISQAGFLQTLTPPAKVPTPQTTYRSSQKYSQVDLQSEAAFFQGNWHATDSLTIIGGVRFTRDDLDLLYNNAPFVPGSLPITTPIITGLRQSVGNSNWSWRVGPQFQVNPDTMVYATASRGYKGPGFSGVTVTSLTQDQSVKPEIPKAYEAGIKTKLFDRRLLVNFDVFDTTYKGFQAQVSDITSPNFSSTIKNAGSLKTKGAELNLQGKPAPELTLGFSGSYIDAKYKDFAGVSCYFGQPEPPCAPPPLAPTSTTRLFNAGGLRLAGTPKWTYNASAAYEKPNLIGSLTGQALLSWNWQGDVVYAVNGDPGTRQDAFGILNGEVAIASDAQNWRVAIYARNIFDKRWASQISSSPTTSQNPGGYYQWFSPDSFRRIGAQLDVNF